jgi:hypothetical protein
MRWILITFILMGLSACQNSSNESQTQWELQSEWRERGPLKARVSLKHNSFSILDQQDMILEVEAPSDLILSFPAFQERLEDIRQVPWRPDDETKSEDGQTQQLKKYLRFEVFESGQQSLPPLRVAYKKGFGANLITGYVDTPALLYNVESIDDPALVQADIARDNSLIRPAPFPWLKVLGYVVLAAAVVMAILKTYRRYANKKSAPPPPPEPAHLWAWRAIQALIEDQEKGELNNEEFVDRLTGILRHYIEKRFKLQAPEQTTEEFLNQGLQQQPQLQQHMEVLEQFLSYADLIKFAGQQANTEDVQKGFDFLKQFIENTQEVAA